MAKKDWELLEKHVELAFPGAKITSGSGRVWGDGDLVGSGISFEAKHHQRVSFDAWWKQTRRQALTFNRVPCLVIWRPPVDLLFSKSIEDEILAVVPLEYLGKLHKQIEELKEQLEYYCMECRESHQRGACNGEGDD